MTVVSGLADRSPSVVCCICLSEVIVGLLGARIANCFKIGGNDNCRAVLRIKQRRHLSESREHSLLDDFVLTRPSVFTFLVFDLSLR